MRSRTSPCVELAGTIVYYTRKIESGATHWMYAALRMTLAGIRQGRSAGVQWNSLSRRRRRRRSHRRGRYLAHTRTRAAWNLR